MFVLLLLASLMGCTTEPLSESWQLDRLRVLGVQAEPAEPRPGDTVTFRSLIYVPYGEALTGTVWFACLPEGSTDFGCTLDEGLTDALSGDLESLSPEEQLALFQQAQEAGLIGFEPLFSPTWTVPEDALASLTEDERREGRSAVVNLTALPAGGDDATEDDVELAYKRVPVSLADTPNRNPVVTGVLVERKEGEGDQATYTEVLAEKDGFTVEAGATYRLTPLLQEGSVETYVYRTTSGTEEQRTEEPYFTWYAEYGQYDQPDSLFPILDVEWTAPKGGFEGALVTVVRDRRGGMDWASLTVRSTPAQADTGL